MKTLAILCLGLALCPYPSQNRKTPAQADKNASYQPIPSPPPTNASSTTGQKKPANNKTFTEHRRWSYHDAIAPQTWSNWFLGIVGIGGIIAALITLCAIKKQTRHIAVQAASMRRQTALLRQSADAARDSAQATLQSVQATINMERALVEINITAPSKTIDAETGEEFIDHNDEFRYGIGIINHGRTIARIISCTVWHDCFSTGAFDKDAFGNSFEITRHMVLGIRKPAIFMNIDIGKLLTDWPSVSNKTKTGMLRVDIHYEDIIQRQPHRTSVIYRYSPEEEGPIRLPEFNQYT
jgi:hypothetical protein